MGLKLLKEVGEVVLGILLRSLDVEGVVLLGGEGVHEFDEERGVRAKFDDHLVVQLVDLRRQDLEGSPEGLGNVFDEEEIIRRPHDLEVLGVDLQVLLDAKVSLLLVVADEEHFFFFESEFLSGGLNDVHRRDVREFRLDLLGILDAGFLPGFPCEKEVTVALLVSDCNGLDGEFDACVLLEGNVVLEDFELMFEDLHLVGLDPPDVVVKDEEVGDADDVAVVGIDELLEVVDLFLVELVVAVVLDEGDERSGELVPGDFDLGLEVLLPKDQTFLHQNQLIQLACLYGTVYITAFIAFLLMKVLNNQIKFPLMTVPPSILIGQMNQKLEKFDDSLALAKNGGYLKINAIRVFYNEKQVRGFEIFYKLNDGDLLKASHNVPKKKKELQSSVFEIGPDDYLSEIQGAYHQDGKKNQIVNITFLTYRGKAGTYGGKGEKQFGYTFNGYTFGPFQGGFKKQIEWLLIPVVPVPQEFMRDIQKVQVNVVFSQKDGQSGQPQFANFAKVAMPQIGVSNQASRTQSYTEAYDKKESQPQPQQQQQPKSQSQQDYTQNRASNPLLSSKYPSFDQPPPQQQQYPYSAAPQYPGQYPYPGVNVNAPQYQYPGQMNYNPYKPQ